MPVPDTSTLEPIAGTFMMKPVPFDHPPALDLDFFQAKAKSIEATTVQEEAPISFESLSLEERSKSPTPPVSQDQLSTWPVRRFACAACTGHFAVNCGPNTRVRCPFCSKENLIP